MKVFVQDGTAAWDAWRRDFEARGKRIPSPQQFKGEKGFGWWFDSLFPATALVSQAS
ncbi:hypothetical protein [Microvirga antarctica]|uniref:hypothetical protein n=1 Tax=Microvirga antarctica TaxID=2819233 RepID=UPI001B300FCF|nr:hypothetical protein [Microvirga antarctica]